MDSKGDELEVPKAVVSRLIKSAIPDTFVAVQAEAKQALTTAAKIFILYATACANDICKAENKSTIMPEHVFKAMEELEFDFGDKLKEALEAHRKDQTQKKVRRTDEIVSPGSASKETPKPQETSTAAAPDGKEEAEKDDEPADEDEEVDIVDDD
eukprot:TRINITY_DN28618_c0_g1_i1.p1 TRINITY_DN28618_c0_g1~~TRINITY_DN28618_c0_g1_i1.p1  ORF type:complete len:155 (-),score=38.29 TRINITY_DN28618_c0_g1_i1:176-640(-)